MEGVKKFFIKQFFYFLFVIGFLLFSLKSNFAQAAEINFTAEVDIYQESSVSSTGRCYGPYFTATKPLLVDIHNIFYNGVSIKTAQDAESVGAKNTIITTKLSGRVFVNCSDLLKEISNGHMPLCSIDISRYDNLLPHQTEFKQVGVRVYSSSRVTLLKDEIEVYIKQYVDESKCFEQPSSGFELCYQIQSDQEEAFKRCKECFDDDGVWTAIGCIPQSSDGIVSTFIQIGLVIGGAIVLIMILVGAFMLSTSQGDPKKTQEAKEIITSAIIGLLFIIFSITILQFIGASVLRIPGFGQ